MNPEFKKIWKWVGIGSVVLFFIFCAIQASHLRPVAKTRSPAVATNKFQPTTEAEVPDALVPDFLAGLEMGATINPALSANMPASSSHIMALAHDQQGNIWIGTEDDGVFRYDPGAAPGSQW